MGYLKSVNKTGVAQRASQQVVIVARTLAGCNFLRQPEGSAALVVHFSRCFWLGWDFLLQFNQFFQQLLVLFRCPNPNG